jgi:O-antigen/teichoic acid export membrane protein
LAQAIAVLTSPILTRLYSPASFGVFSVFVALTSVLVVIGGGRYEYAIVLPAKDEEAMSVVATTAIVAGLFSISLVGLISLAQAPLVRLLGGGDALASWLYAIPGFVLLGVVTAAIRFWFNRRKQYAQMSANAIWRAALTATFTIGLGLAGLGEAGLFTGLILGQLFTTLYFVHQLWRQNPGLVQSLAWSGIRKTARQYQNFPKYLVTSGLIESLCAQLPTFCLASLFGQGVVGYFALATRVVNLPFSLISSSVGDVFRQQASEQYGKTGDCRSLFLQCSRHLLLVSVLPFTFLFFLSPWLFRLVFGAEWEPAGFYVQLMTVMFMIRFVTSPLSVMFYVAEKQKWDLALQSLLLLALGLAFWILGHHHWPSTAAIATYSAAYSVKYLVEFYLAFKFTVKARS